MVKILCIGDPHFKPGNRLETTQLFSETERICDQEKPEIVVVLGDVLDTFEKADMDCFDQSILFLEMIMKKSFLILLIGNHDRKNNQVYCTDEHYFTPLKHWPSTKVVWKPEEIEISNLKILALPYIPTGRMEECFKTFNKNPNDYDIIFAHQEFFGAKMGAIVSQHGDVWKEEYPLCISGHIHQYSQLQDNCIYPGTPFQHGFSDSSDKSLLLLEFLNGEIIKKRIALNIWNKVNISLSPTDLLSFTPEQNCVYNINLIGDLKTIKKTLKNEQIEKLIKDNQINIRIKSTFSNDNNPITKSTGIVSFYECLNSLIEVEPTSVKEIYEHLLNE